MGEVIGVKVTPSLKKAINRILEQGMYNSMGDFAREALREKIRRDYPRIYREVLEAEQEKRQSHSKSGAHS